MVKKRTPSSFDINSSHKKCRSVPHAIGEAIILKQIPNENTLIITLASLIVTEHHTGLPNAEKLYCINSTKLRCF